jgi:multiple antibiotic resistance protein
MTLLSIVAIFFLTMDPFGNVAYFQDVLDHIPEKKRPLVIVRELLIALLAMLAFYFVGDVIIDTLGVSDASVSLTSGIILFLVAVKILFPTSDVKRVHGHINETPFIVPLAIPLTAGPALLATIMLFSHQYGPIVLLGIFIAWALALLVLVPSKYLLKGLGKNGLMAIERLMGMVLILLAIQRLLEGVRFYTETL